MRLQAVADAVARSRALLPHRRLSLARLLRLRVGALLLWVCSGALIPPQLHLQVCRHSALRRCLRLQFCVGGCDGEFVGVCFDFGVVAVKEKKNRCKGQGSTQIHSFKRQ